MDFQELTAKYPEFTYNSYEYAASDRNLQITFHFSITPNHQFHPTIDIPLPDNYQLSDLDNFVFHLGMVEMFSYWKLTCSPRIIVKAGFLNQQQLGWWHRLLIRGLGEFFYQNKIDFTHQDFVALTVDSNQSPKSPIKSSGRHPLVLAAGGKDTAVTLGLLSQYHLEFKTLLINPTPAALQLESLASDRAPLIINRQLDPKLLELNHQGYLNGHTPFSALLAFLGVTTAYLHGCNSVLVSNEASSNEGNVTYLDQPINHQYSKTFTFETDFRNYINQYLITNLEFTSFLRPLHELQIAKIFASFPKFWPIFRSCNAGQSTNSWCGHCPKCLFTYACLYPFIETPELISIFGHDLYQDASLLSLAEELIDPTKAKPFECVGTRKEALVAFYLSYKKASFPDPIPKLLSLIYDQHLKSFNDLQTESTTLLSSWNPDNYLPQTYQSILKSALQ